MAIDVPKMAQNLAPQGWGMPHGFAPHFAPLLPRVFSAGQKSYNTLSCKEKTACPTRGKSVGQTWLVSSLPHTSLPLGERWWGKNLGQNEQYAKIAYCSDGMSGVSA